MFTNKIYLKNREIVAEDTIKLTFNKPANFDFIAGQYVLFGIKNSQKTLTHPMTIASAPYQQELEFIMRLTDSEFKQVIVNMKLGDEAYIGNAIGNLMLGDKSESVVMLAGGIGITPLRSMLLQAEYEKSKQQFTLFYSNQTGDSAVELIELKNIGLENYKTVFTLTNTPMSVGLGDSGRINKAMLLKYLSQLSAHTYYVVGTSSFVAAMLDLLEKSNIPKNQIKIESFVGYKDARTA